MNQAPLLIEVFTIFPDVVESYCQASILGRARREGYLDLRVHDLRSAAQDPHRSVDDAPFGGGPGMVLAPEPVAAAIEAVASSRPLYLLSPGGRRFDQAMAHELLILAGGPGGGPAAPSVGGEAGGFSLLCGRYEGVDERIVDELVDAEVSVGDFVLAGGELGALVVVEAVTRLVPGVLGNEASSAEESFAGDLLEYPQFTRPASWRGRDVPEVLLSGNHARIARWRLARSIERTLGRRPDMVVRRGGLSAFERAAAAEFGVAVPPWVADREPPATGC